MISLTQRFAFREKGTAFMLRSTLCFMVSIMAGLLIVPCVIAQEGTSWVVYDGFPGAGKGKQGDDKGKAGKREGGHGVIGRGDNSGRKFPGRMPRGRIIK